MELEDLKKEYSRLQNRYGSKNLDSIFFGGQSKNPNVMFVFMNPTGKNIASSKEWNGIKAPWVGTKNIWKLFYKIDLLAEDVFLKIQNIKASEWTEEFALEVYEDVIKHNYFITNLGKCTQEDARPLNDSVYLKYLKLLKKEIEIVNPKKIVLFGNQVSSIVLDEKISVSEVRKKEFKKKINKKEYVFYAVYYPVGNGIFNMDKAIEDLNYIIFDKKN